MIANMVVGGEEANSANLQNCQPVSRDAASTMLNVSERSVADAAERKRIYEAKRGPAKAIGARATHQVPCWSTGSAGPNANGVLHCERRNEIATNWVKRP